MFIWVIGFLDSLALLGLFGSSGLLELLEEEDSSQHSYRRTKSASLTGDKKSQSQGVRQEKVRPVGKKSDQ
jgi:hypothetical protein